MESNTEAIIFIPGLEKMEKDQSLNRLIKGIEDHQELANVTGEGSAVISGFNGKRIKIHLFEGKDKSVDLFEAYWGDLVYFIDHDEPLKKIWTSTSLLSYWVFSRIWLALKGSIYLTMNIVSGVLLLIAWYYGILVLGLVALGESSSLFGLEMDPEIMMKIGGLGHFLGGASIWVTSSVIMGIFPVNAVVRIAQFAKSYLQDETLRSKIRKRFAKILQECISYGKYDKVTIVAHSFGAVVAIDFLADYKRDLGQKELALITLGSPVSFLLFRSRWLKKEFDKFLNNPNVARLTNFYSDSDWLSSTPPKMEEKMNFNTVEIPDSSGVLSKLAGKTHNMYFERSSVIEKLIHE